jgi:hypothetical protein
MHSLLVIAILIVIAWLLVKKYRSNSLAKQQAVDDHGEGGTSTDTANASRPSKFPNIWTTASQTTGQTGGDVPSPPADPPRADEPATAPVRRHVSRTWMVLAAIALIVLLKLTGHLNALVDVLVLLFGIGLALVSVWGVVVWIHKGRPESGGPLDIFSSSRATKAERFCRTGDDMCSVGAYEQAIESYDQAIDLDNDFVMAYENRGFAYSQIGHNRAAIRDYEEAIKRGPKTPKDQLQSVIEDLRHQRRDPGLGIPLLPGEDDVSFESHLPTLWMTKYRTIIGTSHGDETGSRSGPAQQKYRQPIQMECLALTNQRLLILSRRADPDEVNGFVLIQKYRFDLSAQRIREWIKIEQQYRSKAMNDVRQTWQEEGVAGIIKGDYDERQFKTPLDPADKRTVASTPLFPIIDINTKWHLFGRRNLSWGWKLLSWAVWPLRLIFSIQPWTGVRLHVVLVQRGAPKWISNPKGVLQGLFKATSHFQDTSFGEIQLCNKDHTELLLKGLRPLVKELVEALGERSNWRGV